MVVRSYRLPRITLYESTAAVRTVFETDGSESMFAPPCVDGQVEQFFIDAAHEMGYSDLMRYAVEHELSHQIVALEQGQPHSPIVWAAAHEDLDSLSQGDKEAEEHLVNRLQQFMNLGIEDSYGCLREVFGSRLEKIAIRLLLTARPWLNPV